MRAVGIWSRVRAALGFELRSASSKARALSTGVQTALRGLATDVEIKPATRIPPGALATAPLFYPVSPGHFSCLPTLSTPEPPWRNLDNLDSMGRSHFPVSAVLRSLVFVRAAPAAAPLFPQDRHSQDGLRMTPALHRHSKCAGSRCRWTGKHQVQAEMTSQYPHLGRAETMGYIGLGEHFEPPGVGPGPAAQVL